jgi:thioredoxin-like negative regulator of GroEL
MEPYILYFTGDGCTVCRTHQEPALAKLGEVRVDKVDAIADRALADRFHVYTLPTTVVMSRDGSALHVNYGYAPAPKLERQLAEARSAGMQAATA